MARTYRPGRVRTTRAYTPPVRLDPRTWRVGTKIAVVLVVLAVVPVLVLTRIGTTRIEDQAAQDGRRELAGLADALATGLDTELQANLELVSGIARDRRVVAFAEEWDADRTIEPELDAEINADLDILKESHPSAGVFFLLDAEGTTIAASDRVIVGNNYAFRPYFQEAITGKTNVSDVYLPIGTTSMTPGTAFAAPIRRGGLSDGAIVGVAVIKSDALTVSSSIDSGPDPRDRRAYIVEYDGIISASSTPDDPDRFASLRPLTPAEQEAATAAKRFAGPVPTLDTSPSIRALVGSRTPGFTTGSIDGRPVAITWEPLTQADWTAVVSEPLATYSAAADEARNQALVIAGLVALVAVAAALAAGRALSRPLHALTDAAAHLEAGTPVSDDELAAVGRRRDDLGALAARLADAARESKAREARLEAQVASLKVEIDQTRRESDVQEIVESDFFNDLQARAAEMRRRAKGDRSGGEA